MSVSLAPLLTDLATGEPGTGEPADESLLEAARAMVADVIRRHGELVLSVRRPGSKVDSALEDKRLDQVEAFLISVDVGLTAMQALPPSDGVEQREIWKLQDDVRAMRTPAMRPIEFRDALAFEFGLKQLARDAAELAKRRLGRIEQHAGASQHATLLLEAGSGDAEVLGHFIKQVRGQCGITVAMFKEAIEKSDGYIRMLERGAKVASAETYERIFRQLGLRVAQDGSGLIVRDAEGRQIHIQLISAIPKKVLAQQARERSKTPVPSSAAERLGWEESGTDRAVVAGDSRGRAPELLLLGEVTKLLANADVGTLTAIAQYLRSGAIEIDDVAEDEVPQQSSASLEMWHVETEA